MSERTSEVSSADGWRKLPEGGASRPELFLVLFEVGTSWLPFHAATVCLIHANGPYCGHTLGPVTLKLQLLIGQRCAAAQLHWPFVQIKKLGMKEQCGM